ncbi:N-substituted formamide deformylase [subsurface metagenome]
MNSSADIVIVGGNVITVDPRRPRAEAIAIKDDKFMLVGSNEEARAVVGTGTKVRELDGMTVVPGFNDAHLHVLSSAQSIKGIRLGASSVRSIGDILNLVGKQARRQEGGWIIGRGYDQNRLRERRHPTRWELDEVSLGNAVYLIQFSGHASVANSKALALANITKHTPDPEGGEIERDPDTGEPTGLVLETPATDLIEEIMPRASYEDIVEDLGIVNQNFLPQGITSFMDAGVGMDFGWSRIIGAYQEAIETGLLNIRCNLAPWHERFLDYTRIDEELQEIDSRLFKFGIRTGLGNEKLRIGPFKIIMDGSASLATAATYEPYQPGSMRQGTGILIMEPEILAKLVSALHRMKWQIAIHAIGDRAIDVTLDAYEAALHEQPRTNHRHRIEHCTMMDLRQMARVEQLSVLCVTQPAFVLEAGDAFANQLGRRRAEETLRFRTLLENNISVAFSSDAPVVSSAPLIGIHGAVNRRTRNGQSYGIGEAISAEKALSLYTLGGAYTTFEEDIKGSIEVGKLADLVVLDKDLTKEDPEGIKDISVMATMVGGKVVYEK